MRRTQRALSHVDIDTYARSIGMRSGREYLEHLQRHRRLDQGGRITAQDIEREHARDPRTPLAAFNRLADWVNAGRTGRDRADRYSDAIAHGIAQSSGTRVDHLAMREQARVQGESLSVMEFANPLTQRLNEADAHRDRQNGIDDRARVEQAHRAAMSNPDTIRRAEIEREWARHEGGPSRALYAHERRELGAQLADNNVERLREQMVRDTDPNRLPDRGDDRRDDIGLAWDCCFVDEVARDELSLRDNPLLEHVDNALTHADSMDRD